jgi:gamma-glutamyl-gamma-aminobutyrate hydrolase PuuD
MLYVPYNTVVIAPGHISERQNYIDWVNSMGFQHYFLHDDEDITDRIRLLLFCGGADFGTRELRDANEERWFRQAYGKIPVVGVCRGMQMANLLLGGSLKEVKENEVQHTSEKLEIDGVCSSHSRFHDIIYEDRTFKVNTRHHICLDKINPDFKILAVSKDDVPEMAEGKNSLFVQWHPERPEVRGTEADTIVANWIKEKLQ